MGKIILTIFLSRLLMCVSMSTSFLAGKCCLLAFPLWDPIILTETRDPILIQGQHIPPSPLAYGTAMIASFKMLYVSFYQNIFLIIFYSEIISNLQQRCKNKHIQRAPTALYPESFIVNTLPHLL